VVNNYLEITISDNGIGIEADKLERIFEAFEQADGSIAREYGGAGLGLAVTKQLVHLHGGEIWVVSTPGKGSKFTFTLPVSQAKLPPMPLQSSPEISKLLEMSNEDLLEADIPVTTDEPFVNPEVLAPSSVGFQILIVDDEPINLQVLVNHLSLQNYRITQTSNGMEALTLIEQGFKPDLVLLDVMMPRMTGYEVCKKIREKFPATELPVVLLTANNQVSDLVEGFGSGANDYLTKPISKNELLARIKTHIELSKINIAYGRFVPREFLEFLERKSIVDVQLGDQVHKDMTILFSDIRSFTTLSENMSPKENFDFLNEYLKRVGPVIRNHNGFIDKYIGDAVMALFPKDPDDALEAAIAMQHQVSLYNAEREAEGYPSIAIGVGLHTGSLMLGTIGEEQRMESTVIADAVNLASRMEGLTKVYGAGILISEQTLSQLNAPENYSHRFLGRVTVKGKKVAVAVFEVYEGDSDSVKKLKTQTLTEFERGVELYEQKQFAQAQLLFESLLKKNEQDKPARLYAERCKQAERSHRDGSGDAIEAVEERR
jgi:two-component system sensor histidine kinase ChiS